MQEKGQHDDELIATLTQRLNQLQKHLQESNQNRTLKVHTRQESGTKKNSHEEIIEMSKLKELLGEKEAKISELSSQLFIVEKDLEKYKNSENFKMYGPNPVPSRTGADGAAIPVESDEPNFIPYEDLLHEKHEMLAELNSLKSEHGSLRNLVKTLNEKIREDHPDRDDIRFSELFKSKKDDLAVYEHTIEETRRIFMEAMKQMKGHIRKARHSGQ